MSPTLESQIEDVDQEREDEEGAGEGDGSEDVHANFGAEASEVLRKAEEVEGRLEVISEVH